MLFQLTSIDSHKPEVAVVLSTTGIAANAEATSLGKLVPQVACVVVTQ